jgi:predicted MFS family arabinose efflux permease
MNSSLRLQVVVFTATRVLLSTMHRMIYPFLLTFGRGLGVDMAAITLAVTARSLAGASGPFLAWVADNHGRKVGMIFGLGLFVLGTSLVVIWPTYPIFFLALILTVLGRYVFDPAMQAYLGDRVPYDRRGRVTGITEMGWSLAFILGVPLMGFLIARRGWMAPFPVLAILGLVAIGALAWLVPRDPPHPDNQNGLWRNLRGVLTSPLALTGLAMSLMLSAGNEVVNLVFGVWMESSFGLRIAALGVASAVIGFAELGGETLTATITDRLGKPRAVAAGVLLNCMAALALPFLGSTLAGAFIGLFLFYLTFEFAIVSSIALMTEVFPSARATLMAGSLAAHSLGRALGALVTAPLFALGQASLVIPDIMPSALASVVFNLLGLLALYRLGRGMASQPVPQAPAEP